ncbi:conserved hypothetical protein [Luminiphilus syltensis NOR5-1B]|uniref:Uncharacterized protein n=1 Tax=Luminiphilus syltensis NOR5-1B TaxID=565045 RepID=B8KYN4_9GAMM|nr:hypothetical protein [Luminiphilus syltensis]EED36051.1 conserved hypothetical protein [Luminiphilus syltensis NOR5-1B]
MDSFSKKYLTVLVILIVAVVAYNLLGQDERVEAINAMLSADEQLSAYPYQFRVLRIENTTAIVGSPRSSDVSVIHYLRTQFPELSASTVDDPAVMEAQIKLARHQSRAMALVQSTEYIEGVGWELDERWFNERGVFLNF